MECLIVGAGVIGLSVAYELVCRRHQVMVIDSGRIGRGASWAGAGILPAAPHRRPIDPLDPLRTLSHQLHPMWAKQLRDETGIDTGFRRCGGIYLARSAAEAATLMANAMLWQEQGIASERLSHSQLLELEPELKAMVDAGGVRGAWLLPEECQLRNPRHLQALRQACHQRGVCLVENVTASNLVRLSNGRVEVKFNRESVMADHLIICSGAWARLHLEQLNLANGIMPIRGQMVLFQAKQTLLQHVVNEGHRYLVPRDDGRLLVGSCEEEVGYHIETTPDMIGELKSWAVGIVACLKDIPIEKTWAGLRPGSFDGFPYLGPVPGLTNVYLAAGHFRSGLHLSCGTAQCVADIVEKSTTSINLHDFRIGRG